MQTSFSASSTLELGRSETLSTATGCTHTSDVTTCGNDFPESGNLIPFEAESTISPETVLNAGESILGVTFDRFNRPIKPPLNGAGISSSTAEVSNGSVVGCFTVTPFGGSSAGLCDPLINDPAKIVLNSSATIEDVFLSIKKDADQVPSKIKEEGKSNPIDSNSFAISQMLTDQRDVKDSVVPTSTVITSVSLFE